MAWHAMCYMPGKDESRSTKDTAPTRTEHSSRLLISSKQGSIPPLFSPGLDRGFFLYASQPVKKSGMRFSHSI